MISPKEYIKSKNLCQINMSLLPMKIHYFISTAGCASILPFLSTISKQRGYSSVVVGWMFTILPMTGLLTPAVGGFTDKYKCRKSMLITCLITMCVFISILMFIPGTFVDVEMDDTDVFRSIQFWLYFGSIILLYMAFMSKLVLEDTICMGILGENKHKYGEQRMWGAIGAGTMSIISGVCVDWFSKGQEEKNYIPAFIIALICFFLDICVTSKIKLVEDKSKIKVSVTNVKKLFMKIKVLSFLFWIVTFGLFASVVSNYVFWYLEDITKIYHPEMKPWIKTIQGFTLTIQCFAGDVPFFFLSSYILKKLNHMQVFSLMFFTFASRFFLYWIIKNPVLVLPVEVLNGITFALAYSAAISYAAHLSPPGAEGSLQGIVGMFLYGIGLPSGSLVGGYLFHEFGSIISFKIIGCIALTTCIAHIIVNQLINTFSNDKNIKQEQSHKVEQTGITGNV